MPRYALFKDNVQIGETFAERLYPLAACRMMDGCGEDGILYEGWEIKEIPEVEND